MREPSLRQFEALMAVVEAGSVSRAAERLSISQPAASKLIATLEDDTEMQLFDRASGRLVATEQGMRLYNEANRVFGGVGQLIRAVEAIRRENRGQLRVGVMPGLSGGFIVRAIRAFRDRFPEAFISVDTRSSQFLADWMISGRLDVAILVTRVDHPTISTRPVHSKPMVCLLPIGHPLAAKARITPEDLEGEPFIAFARASLTRNRVDAVFERAGLRPDIRIEAATAPNVCEFVAGGMGVTVVDPLVSESVKGRVEMRPFDPATSFEFHTCWPSHSRNSRLVSAFVEEVTRAAEAFEWEQEGPRA
ncbi:MAG: LysR family transcriptional regulator [Rhodobacteraceae bacterium]|nr:LysR family transcriptional regulator [Paracoccaceae bacterium]MBR9820683.1 LysR family transcriptional regulator [Paracoccaceae bacterium]